MMTILWIVNIIGGYLYKPLNEHKNLHFDYEYQEIDMSSDNYEDSGYGLDLDLLTILY